jgi:hypothetical protein
LEVAHEYAKRREHDEFILVRASESKTLRPVLRFVLLGDFVIGTRGRLVHLILASGRGRFPDSWPVTTRRSKSTLHILPYPVDLL